MERGGRSAPCGAGYLHNLCSLEAAPRPAPLLERARNYCGPIGGPACFGSQIKRGGPGRLWQGNPGGGRRRLAAGGGTLLPGQRRRW